MGAERSARSVVGRLDRRDADRVALVRVGAKGLTMPVGASSVYGSSGAGFDSISR